MLIILWRLVLCWFIVDFGLDAFNYLVYDVPITSNAALSACIISSLTFLEMLVLSILGSTNNDMDRPD
jgi:hypothetical protein